jgi:hypothetical protein
MIIGVKYILKWVYLMNHQRKMVDQWKMHIKSNECRLKFVLLIFVLFLFRYLFAYEDLSKKLGTMNAPNAYFGGRTSMSSDSRRSLMRVRQQSEEKKSIPIKQQVNS